MISIEAYRIAIGNFNFTPQTSLRPLCKNLVVGSIINSEGLSRLLGYVPFCFIFFHFTLALLIAGDIESNPGPVTPDKVITGSFHQGDLIYSLVVIACTMRCGLYVTLFLKVQDFGISGT